MAKQPEGWRSATIETITRIQQVFGMHQLKVQHDQTTTGLTEHAKIRLYEQAHLIVQAQGRTQDATQYWNTFVNVLRTLVAGMSDVDPQEVFE
jgi:hypothetical protein